MCSIFDRIAKGYHFDSDVNSVVRHTNNLNILQKRD